MSNETATNSALILHNRYNHLLRPLRNIHRAAETLCDKGFISSSEKWQIEADRNEEGKRNLLCGFLTAKGASNLVPVSEVLSLENRHQNGNLGYENRGYGNPGHGNPGYGKPECGNPGHGNLGHGNPGEFSNSQKENTGTGNSGSASNPEMGDPGTSEERSSGIRSASSSTVTSASDGSSGESDEGWDSGWSKERRPDPGHQPLEYVGGNGQCVYEGMAACGGSLTDEVRSKLSCHGQPPVSPSQLSVPVDGKHMKTDVPDPPMERISAESASHTSMKDPFAVLFFTLITQLLHSLWNSRNSPKSSTHNHAHKDPDDEKHHGQPSLIQWLTVDTQSDEVRDYFPTDTVKSINPNPDNPVSLKLSLLLDAFQQLLRAMDGLKHENQSLQRKGKMYDELARKFRALELKMTQLQQTIGHKSTLSPTKHGIAPPPQHAPALSGRSQNTDHVIAALQEKVAHLEAEVEQVGQLKQAFSRSEERCLQLVEVTQQWALECEDKVKMIELLEKEAEQAKGTIQQLDNRVAKYKKYWMETKDLPRGGQANSGQFEELRTELAMRRELYDQVLVQRDEATHKVQALLAEIEGLKDHNVQLIDRAANFKVQAQAKEPSVREMSNLLEQKGKLEQDMIALRKENAMLSDKIVALEVLVEDLTPNGTNLRGQGNSFNQPPRAKRSEDMVTGYNVPHQIPSAAHLMAPQGSQFVIPSNNYHGRNYAGGPVMDDTDVLSLESSDAGSGSFSSHESTERKERGRSAYSNPASPRKAPPQQRSRDALLNPEFRSRDVPSRSQEPAARELPISPPASDEDYTSKIRYPNNSRVLVRPLVDEDFSLKEGRGGGRGETRPREAPGAASNEPFYCDRSHFNYDAAVAQRKAPPPNQPTAVLPPTSPFLTDGNIIERTCPVCQHTFFTLSETEFQTHVAVCYK